MTGRRQKNYRGIIMFMFLRRIVCEMSRPTFWKHGAVAVEKKALLATRNSYRKEGPEGGREGEGQVARRVWHERSGNFLLPEPLQKLLKWATSCISDGLTRTQEIAKVI